MASLATLALAGSILEPMPPATKTASLTAAITQGEGVGLSSVMGLEGSWATRWSGAYMPFLAF